jgi:type I restriction enzyme S subunit
VPKGWRWVELQDVARLESGHTPSRKVVEYWEGGDVPWLSLKDIRGMTSRYVMDTIDKPTMLGIDNSSARVLPKGTVAFCRTASIGNVAILGQDMATSQDFVDWVCGPELLPEFLYEAFKASGPTIYMPTVERFKILLPPLSEQKRIADILDKADTIRRKRQEAVEHYDALLDAAFAYNVGAGATDYKEWNSITLGEIADFVGGSSLPEGELFEGQEHGLLLVKVGDMNLPGNEITIKTAREWYGSPPNGFALCTQDGIVIPKRGGAIGTNKKRLLSRDALLDPNLMGIVPKDHTHTAWLFQWFQQFDLKRLVSGSTVPQLNKKDLAPLTLQLPPSECLEAFETSSARIRASQEVAIQASHESSELFNSLVQRAFKGDL